MSYVQKMDTIIRNITKSDIAEFKVFKIPPSGAQQVGEAMCFLFAKQPSYQNFVKLLSSTDFLDKLSSFDLNSVSEYALKNIKKYIQMENFNPEHISKVSRGASAFCEWIIAVFKYCSTLSSVNFHFYFATFFSVNIIYDF